jgi:putative oxidoreductase
MNSDALERWSPYMLAVLRIVTALVFLEHGTQKLLGFPPASRPQPELFSLMGVAGVLEIGGGILLLLGLFTRPVAFVMSGFMAAAYFIGHASRDFFPVNNGGDAAILYCFVFLYFVFSGPGAWSIDKARTPARAGAVYGR